MERLTTTAILDYLRKGFAIDDKNILDIHNQIMNDHFIVNTLLSNLEIKKFWQSQGKKEYDDEIKFMELILTSQNNDKVKME